MSEPGPSAQSRVMLAAALFAVDPAGLGGILLRAGPGAAREAFLAGLRALLPAEAPLRRIPLGIVDSRLLGGLDLVATLRLGRPVADRGVLADSDGGVVLLAMAERIDVATAARIAAVLDNAEVALERDGLAVRSPVSIGVVALDEGASDDEGAPAVLVERLGFLIELTGIAARDVETGFSPAAIRAARALVGRVDIAEELVDAICAAAASLGIDSIRALLMAVRAAKAAAALNGRTEVLIEDIEWAGQLVLAPRACSLERLSENGPPPSADEAGQGENGGSRPDSDQLSRQDDCAAPADEGDSPASQRSTQQIILQATQAAIPPELLAQINQATAGSPAARPGKRGALKKSDGGGRPVGVRRGAPRRGERLNIIETLRAAAPWQKLRLEAAGASARCGIHITAQDFHVTRRKQHAETVTIFAVDASGSSAFNRLAEAKGAIELLLAECYVRRDQVALLAFRGRAAETLLPPTRSLVRAKRLLAEMPGGGGTPLSSGIEAAIRLAYEVKRKGRSPFTVFMTDGAANISRSGEAAGRKQALDDAFAAARLARSMGLAALVVDIAPRPQPAAAQLASEMNARYLPLPYGDAAAIVRAVRIPVGPKERSVTN